MKENLLKILLKIVREQESQRLYIDSSYNIFSVLRIMNKEVTLHSRMIVDLLNPDGAHGMGSKFLAIFLHEIEMNDRFNSCEIVEVVDEKAAGGLRRIDIYLEDESGNIIIIENKIGAGDQCDQLYDYYNFAKTRTNDEKNISLCYLTLGGGKPSEYSLNGLDETKYKCISYSVHILNWINACIKEIGNSKLKEVLLQYKQTLEYLAHSRMRNLNEIFSKLDSNEDYESLVTLSNEITSFQASLPARFVELLVKELELRGKDGYNEDGAYWIKVSEPTSQDNEMWYRISVRGPFRALVQKSLYHAISDTVLDLLKESGVDGQYDSCKHWWCIKESFEYSKWELNDVRKLLQGEKISLIEECADSIIADIERIQGC